MRGGPYDWRQHNSSESAYIEQKQDVAKKPRHIAENTKSKCEYDIGAKIASVALSPIHSAALLALGCICWYPFRPALVDLIEI